MTTIADRLKDLRSQKGVNQDMAAEACNMSRIALARYETGTRVPRAENAARLADYYGVSVDYLLGRETAEEKIVTREGPIEVVRFDGTKKDSKSNVLAAIYAELQKLSEEDLKVALQHAKFLNSQK